MIGVSKAWFLYIVKCKDGSLYTGITINIEKRVDTHNKGKGAKSLKGKLPVELVYSENFTDRSSASKREIEIKLMKRSMKLRLIHKIKLHV